MVNLPKPNRARKDLLPFTRFTVNPTYAEARTLLMPLKKEIEVNTLITNSVHSAAQQSGREVEFILPMTLSSYLRYTLMYNLARRLVTFHEQVVKDGDPGREVKLASGVGVTSNQIGPFQRRVFASSRELVMMTRYINKRYRDLYKALSTNIVRRPN